MRSFPIFSRATTILFFGGLALACTLSAQNNTYTETVNGVSFTMVRVQGGTFTMGSDGEGIDGCRINEFPAHPVTLSDYSIGETEVTVGQFKAFVDATGYITTAEKNGMGWVSVGNGWEQKEGVNWRDDVRGDLRSSNEYDHPVIHVSWEDAMAFCEWLSVKANNKYRLPTEAEWEFAARGGRKSRNYRYSGSNKVEKIAWCSINSIGSTHSVKRKKPNELGLYDMTGNVWEWCSDRTGEYSTEIQINPTGPTIGSDRVYRGGSYGNDEQSCGVTIRRGGVFSGSCSYLGFRLAAQ